MAGSTILVTAHLEDEVIFQRQEVATQPHSISQMKAVLIDAVTQKIKTVSDHTTTQAIRLLKMKK